MTPLTRLVIAVAMALLPLLARAEGKCLDDPRPWKDGQGKNVLVVTWTIPFPAGATVERGVGTDVFQALNAAAGSEIPAGFPTDNLINLTTTAYPNGPGDIKVMTSPQELQVWEQQFDVVMQPAVMQVFNGYFQDKKHVYGTVVEHPALASPVGYRFCTCTLQRAVVIWENGKEQLYVRSSFRSAKNPLSFVNFVPPAGLKFSFPSSRIWFPVKLNRVLPEPGVSAYLVLDVLTKKRLTNIPQDQVKIIAQGTVTLGSSLYQYVRLTRRYDLADPNPVEDLSLQPPH